MESEWSLFKGEGGCQAEEGGFLGLVGTGDSCPDSAERYQQAAAVVVAEAKARSWEFGKAMENDFRAASKRTKETGESCRRVQEDQQRRLSLFPGVAAMRDLEELARVCGDRRAGSESLVDWASVGALRLPGQRGGAPAKHDDGDERVSVKIGPVNFIDRAPEDELFKIYASLGTNVTLPCRLLHTSGVTAFANVGIRVRWSKVAEDGTEEEVFVSMGFRKVSYGSFEGRVYLQEADKDDASLVVTDLSMDDTGKYRCEVINGMDDTDQDINLEVQNGAVLSEMFQGPIDGVVFPYSPRLGRYNLNFHDAEKACLEQDAVVASFDQLYEAWRSGLDWCNAGWLDDGSVQYPITKPREACGGSNNNAGLRTYGLQDKSSRYDVFCFASAIKGRFYWLVQPDRLTYDEAVQACIDDGAEIAKVGHMFAAWKLEGFDRCDAGWLADGSIRYPISRPRKNCSPTEAAVRFVGFPDKKQKLYGVYCYKAGK
ncbi:hyaluronan and proteoglycan link protein 1-like [Diretmus argenteus]